MADRERRRHNDHERLVQHIADAIWREYALSEAVPPPPTESMWVRYARAAVARMDEIGGNPPVPPRVFRDGETVPAGVCVLHEDGTVGYLDVDAASCVGPLVEVFLPSYYAAVNGDVLARGTP